MAAQIPIKDDPKANEAAMEKVRADKLREVRAGHDGTWIAHPALAPIANEIFNKYMPGPNQLFNRREDVHVTRDDLLNTNVPGSITEEGIRQNLRIGLSYMEGWLRGIGCIPINNLMVRTLPFCEEKKKWQVVLTVGAGGCCYGGSLPQPALAVGSPQRDNCRGQEGRQGLRSASAAGTGGPVGTEGSKGQQVPTRGSVFRYTGHWRRLCRLLDNVSSLLRVVPPSPFGLTNTIGCCMMRFRPRKLLRSCNGRRQKCDNTLIDEQSIMSQKISQVINDQHV